MARDLAGFWSGCGRHSNLQKEVDKSNWSHERVVPLAFGRPFAYLKEEFSVIVLSQIPLIPVRRGREGRKKLEMGK
jgi:hypothetical protein